MKTKSRNKRVALLTSTLIIVLCGAMGYLTVPTVSADITSASFKQTAHDQIKKSKIKNTSLGVLFGIIIVVVIAAIKGCFPC